MFSRISALAATCLALAACQTANRPIGEADPYFGEAVKYNAAIQTIDPDPVYPPGGALPGDNGEVGAAAVKRYRTDKVKQVEVMGTTEGVSSSTGPK